MERCQRGRSGRTANALSALSRTEGSNPSLSASPVAALWPLVGWRKVIRGFEGRGVKANPWSFHCVQRPGSESERGGIPPTLKIFLSVVV
jgi:hypothetical protein